MQINNITKAFFSVNTMLNKINDYRYDCFQEH